MDISAFQDSFVEILKSQKLIDRATILKNSLIVKSYDGSCFYLNVIKTKNYLVDDIKCKKLQEYTETHSQKDFLKDLTIMSQQEPGFFYSFLFIKKFNELGIIDQCIAENILNNAIDFEQELKQFILRMISYYKINTEPTIINED